MPTLLEILGLRKPKAAQANAEPKLTRDQQAAMLTEATAYQQALAAAEAARKRIPAAAGGGKHVQAQFFDRARAEAQAGRFQAGAQILGQVNAVVQEAVDYARERKKVEEELAKLRAHRHAAHVAAETGRADAKLQAAQADADKGGWTGALAGVVQARAAVRDGVSHADRYGACERARLQAENLQTALTAHNWTGSSVTAFPGKLTDAANKANARQYDAAIGIYNGMLSEFQGLFRSNYTEPRRKDVAALKKKPAAALVDGEIKKAEGLIAALDAAITGQQWQKVQLTNTEVNEVIFAAGRIADRGAAYAKERAATVKSIDAMKGNKTLAPQLASLNALVLKADALASREQMQMEDGIDALKSIQQTVKQLDGVAKASAAYLQQRKAAETALGALEKHVAADKVGDEIAAVKALMQAAAAQAGDLTAGPPGLVDGGEDFPGAIATLKKAVADLDTAKTVADGLTGVAAVEKMAAGTPDAKSVDAAIKAVEKDLSGTRADKKSALIAKDLLPVDNAIAAAKKLLGEKKPQDASNELVLGAQALADARRKLVEFNRNTKLRETLEKRMAELRKTPDGAAVPGRVDAVVKLTEEAAALDRDGQWLEAAKKLHDAETAAKAADDAAAAHKAYAGRRGALEKLAKDPAYASVKPALEKALADAATAAGDPNYDFAGAVKALASGENQAKAASVESAAKAGTAKPADVEKLAQEMLKNGGTGEVDALIARLPDTTDVKVLHALAKARFGIEITEEQVDENGDPAADGMQQMAVKGMCQLMAKVPADVLNNPSLKKIARRGGRPFPFYSNGDNQITMNSRPGESQNAMFPARPPGLSDADWEDEKKKHREAILPADIEASCQPANDQPEDYFDFNFLHEVAHAIDDAKQYMAGRTGQPAFGGWISHGGDVDSIARAVAKKKGFDKTPEQIAYVAALIAGSQAEIPAKPADDDGSFDAALDAITEWHAAATTDDVWETQSLQGVLDIDGRIYHCAYKESNTWVSYLKAARSRGITGYQFRAPGEWFSELYAAFKVGKLKKDHPSHGWLAELSI